MELRPTFSAAKITRSARRLAKELVSTAKAHQHRHDQLVRLCAPVLKLHNINEQAFDALMEWVRQRLEQLQREATVRLERAHAQSSTRSSAQSAERLALRNKSVLGVAEPSPLAQSPPDTSPGEPQPEADWSLG
jgi:hypothetical protein